MGKAKGQNVCLLGLSDSGKTLLYLRVRIIALYSVHNDAVEYNNNLLYFHRLPLAVL